MHLQRCGPLGPSPNRTCFGLCGSPDVCGPVLVSRPTAVAPPSGDWIKRALGLSAVFAACQTRCFMAFISEGGGPHVLWVFYCHCCLQSPEIRTDPALTKSPQLVDFSEGKPDERK
uniref:Uncharacterized protein n=1 Tax=Knipowitschia caucasica TaxID=637954 RepID=A0AAV2LEU2_KNICA